MRGKPLVGLVVMLAGCGGGAASLAPEPPQATTTAARPSLDVVEIASGLDRPVYVAAAPGEPGRLYVVEQAGVVRAVEGDAAAAAPFLDIRELVLTGPPDMEASEQGLLSLAFAPDYASGGRFYVTYTDRTNHLNVVEYRARGGLADPGSARQLLRVAKESDGHNGGQLQFGPDGRLYAGIGDDKASQSHPQNLAADDPFGKILALDVDEVQAIWEVVGYGLRNPWRFSFDRETGDLWIGDVGELSWEEVSVVTAGGGPWNLGWDGYEGFERVEWDEGGHNPPRGPGRLVWPVAVFGHDQGCSVIGGYVYRGRSVESLRGRYLFGDFCTGQVWSLDPADPAAIRLELDLPSTLASFGEDEAGELYLVSRRGRVFRLGD